MDSEVRALTARLGYADTPAQCEGMARRAGWSVFGLEFGSECWAGASLEAAMQLGPSGSCTSRCPGDPTQMCGGSWSLSLYTTSFDCPPMPGYSLSVGTDNPGTTTCFDTIDRELGLMECDVDAACIGFTTDPLASRTCTKPGTPITPASSYNQCFYVKDPSRTYIGCYTDSDVRRLPTHLGWLGSLAQCEQAARQGGFSLFGVENGNECWAGYDLAIATQLGLRPDGSCGMHCADNITDMCGGSWALSLWALSTSGSCSWFRSDGQTALAVNRRTTSCDSCRDGCAQNPYCGWWSFEDGPHTPFNASACPGDTGGLPAPVPSPLPAPPKTNASTATRTFLGCYRDSTTHVLPVSLGQFSIWQCELAARMSGYSLFALGSGGQCWGGYDEAQAMRLGAVEPTQCNQTCSGEPSASCGGPSLVSLYKATPLGCPTAPGYFWHSGLDHVGDEIACLVTTDTQEAFATCNLDPACQAVTVDATNNRSCLKRSNASSPSSDPSRCFYQKTMTRTYLGCYADSMNRVLPAWLGWGTTPPQCEALARASGYRYFGVEYGADCWAGNSLEAATRLGTRNNCDTPCQSDPTFMCGGWFAIAMYEAINFTCPVIEGYTYTLGVQHPADDIACFAGTNTQAAANACSSTTSCVAVSMDPLHNRTCLKSVGAPTSIAQYPGQCFYTKSGKATYQGCYADNATSRVLPNWLGYRSSPRQCLQLAASRGFDVWGVENGWDCMAGGSLEQATSLGMRQACTLQCVNETSAICGGPNAISLYTSTTAGDCSWFHADGTTGMPTSGSVSSCEACRSGCATGTYCWFWSWRGAALNIFSNASVCDGPAPPPPSAPVPMPAPVPSDTADILSLTNRYRQDHHASSLTWDGAVASRAQAWADRLAGTCTLDHWGKLQQFGEGQNLYISSGQAAGADAVAAWYREVASYRFTDTPWTENGAAYQSIAHFTQLVWRNTQYLGCGVAQSTCGTYIVCNYSPAGNMATDEFFKDNVLPV